jgi:hypothetical protein
MSITIVLKLSERRAEVSPGTFGSFKNLQLVTSRI